MAKRNATTELNHDNWDREEEPEEVGVFKKADTEILQTRVIKTAKRRVNRNADGSPDSKPNVFAGFSGFGNPSNSLSNSPFSFLSQNTKTDDKSKTEPDKNMKKDEPKMFSNSPFANAFQQKDTKLNNSSNEASKIAADMFKPFENAFKPKENDKNSQNLEVLKDLNFSCSKWIAENLEKNPYCILTPIFEDYKKHLAKLDLKFTSNDNNKDNKTGLSTNVNAVSDNSTKPFAINPVAKTDVFSTEEKKERSSVETATKPSFQFSAGSLGSASNPFGGFASVPTFNLNQISKPPESNNEAKNDEESDEPPKNEFVPVVEDDSIFDIRCKVFIKKDGEFVSKGVGTMFIKPVKDSNRNQLLVRADTSLGNILLNFLLMPSLTIQKMGTNNVMVVCLPTPDSKPPPVPVLIRVKTSDDCDRVIKKLEECKGS